MGKYSEIAKEGLEFNLSQYDEIDNYCKYKNIDWFASSWDEISQIEMRKYNFNLIKLLLQWLQIFHS